ncbi:MAG: hypothetical protein ABIG89_05290 [Candidatus Woesearchaeota archaeon]
MDHKDGIKIFAIVILILSVASILFNLFMGLYMLFINSLIILIPLLSNLFKVVLGIIVIVGSIYMLKYKEIGRKMVVYTFIVLIVIYILNTLISLIIVPSAFKLISLFSFMLYLPFYAIYYGGVMYYFTRTNVKKVFK